MSVEPEILAGRRVFAVTQQLFAGAPLRRLPERVSVGWHGTDVDAETGAFAVVRQSWGLDDLIGEVLRLTTDTGRVCFVYVLGARDVPTDISITRRAFFPTLALLAEESVRCIVEVVS